MNQQETVLDIEHRAWEERVSIRFLCQQAGVHPTTFYRWKKSPGNLEPVNANMGTIAKLYAALDRIGESNRHRLKKKARLAA